MTTIFIFLFICFFCYFLLIANQKGSVSVERQQPTHAASSCFASGSGYFRAKLAQETLIKASRLPYTIVRATQFFEFAGGIAQFATEGATVRLPSALIQPIVSDDVAAALADVAIAEPLNETVELAGPESVRMDELIRRYLSAKGDSRKVITDPQALYYGVKVDDQSLTPGAHPRLGPTSFEEWLKKSN